VALGYSDSVGQRTPRGMACEQGRTTTCAMWDDAFDRWGRDEMGPGGSGRGASGSAASGRVGLSSTVPSGTVKPGFELKSEFK
jgi:hypothetical protein